MQSLPGIRKIRGLYGLLDRIRAFKLELGTSLNMQLAAEELLLQAQDAMAIEPLRDHQRWNRHKVRQPLNKPGLLTLTIKDKSALYLAYMPFVRNGGLFIPTNSNYRLGDEVFMLLNLMGEDEKLRWPGA